VPAPEALAPPVAGGLRIVFAGTPAFARRALEALLASHHRVVGVLTQPDRPAGRGLRLQPSEVKVAALAAGVPLAQPRSLRLDGRFADDAAAARAWLAEHPADVMVVAAYGLLLPRWVLETPPLGCLNIHASLLPRWRGAAPIHRAIEAGDAETGITLMQMDEGLDTGAMLLSQACPIRQDDTTGTLHERLADLGARLVVRGLDALQAGTLRPRPQPADGVTYARKVDKDESTIDWQQPADAIERRLRAFDPFPGGVTTLPGGEAIKVWRARVQGPVPRPAPGPGTVVASSDAGIDVACGQGVLRLLELQRPGGRRLPVREFQAGRPVAAGTRLGLAPQPVARPER
jgi:methionyl-tRNA formyltransferase